MTSTSSFPTSSQGEDGCGAPRTPTPLGIELSALTEGVSASRPPPAHPAARARCMRHRSLPGTQPHDHAADPTSRQRSTRHRGHPRSDAGIHRGEPASAGSERLARHRARFGDLLATASTPRCPRTRSRDVAGHRPQTPAGRRSRSADRLAFVPSGDRVLERAFCSFLVRGGPRAV